MLSLQSKTNKTNQNKTNTTMKANNFKKEMARVMRDAWKLVRETKCTMSEGLKMAWRALRLRIELRAKNVVTFFFIKKDGTKREAHGTLNFQTIPSECRPTTERETRTAIQTYFDLDRMAWRSFKIQTLQ